MAILTLDYGSPTSIPITLGTTATGTMRQSAAVGPNDAVDHIIKVTLISAGSGVSATGNASIYLCPSADEGATFAGGASGTDSAFTGRKENAILARLIDVVAINTTYQVVFNAAAACGQMPRDYAVVVLNSSGATFAGGTIVFQAVSVVST